MAEHELWEILEIFEKHEAAAAPIYDIADIFRDTHFKARRTLIDVEDPDLGVLKMQNVVARFSVTPGRIRHAGRKLGENNREVYIGMLGLSEAQMNELKREGVI